MWQILFFALPPQIKAPNALTTNKTSNKTSNKMKYYNPPVNRRIPKYNKTTKNYKTYK